MVGIMLPAEPRVCGKEPCSRLWLFIVPRFLPKRICGHSWQRKQFGVPLWGASVCVQALPQLSVLLRHGPGA